LLAWKSSATRKTVGAVWRRDASMVEFTRFGYWHIQSIAAVQKAFSQAGVANFAIARERKHS
jgi:hypothetical protein